MAERLSDGGAAVWPRRQALLGGLGAWLLPRPARAEWLRDEIVVYAEPPLRAVMAAVGARMLRDHGVTVRVFCAPPAQMLGLLAHGTQDDVLITQASFMRQAEQAGLVAPGRPLWRNRLRFVARGDGPRDVAFDSAVLVAALGGGMLAVPDPTPAATFDGMAVVQRLGLAETLAGHVQGAADTGDALGMVRMGAAAMAMAHVSEIAGVSDLRSAMLIPGSGYDPIDYDVALTKTAWSRNQDMLLSALPGSEDAARFGLERRT